MTDDAVSAAADATAPISPPQDEAIRLGPYDPAWPARFEAERDAIVSAIGPWLTGGVHHVGSTSVPGLAAKPIIDIMAGVSDLDHSRACIDLLAPLRYQYAPYRVDIMHWFCKPQPDHRTHHLHLVPAGSARFTDVLALRDYLRAHPDAAAEYVALKRDLAAPSGRPGGLHRRQDRPRAAPHDGCPASAAGSPGPVMCPVMCPVIRQAKEVAGNNPF